MKKLRRWHYVVEVNGMTWSSGRRFTWSSACKARDRDTETATTHAYRSDADGPAFIIGVVVKSTDRLDELLEKARRFAPVEVNE